MYSKTWLNSHNNRLRGAYERINFKYKKKAFLMASMSSSMSSTLLVLLLFTTGVAGETFGSTPWSCGARKQQQIFDSIPECKVRETVIDLRPTFANRSDIIQVMPSHAVVQRCSGGCSTALHTCQAQSYRLRTVEVMLVLEVFPQGEHEILCSEAILQEDEECTCDCRVREEHCLPGLQNYHPESCSCMCTNMEEWSSCLNRNMVWDPYSCSCSCPAHTWQPCSTGYVFDLTHSCRCVQISLIASEGMIAAIIIIVAVLVLTLCTGYIMYRTQTGLFRNRKDVPSPKLSPNRVRLMTQKSRSEFDMVSANSKLTLKDFDESRRTVLRDEQEKN